MVCAEDIRVKILELADKRGPSRAFNITEVARVLDPVDWKNKMEQIRFVASILVREGKIKPLYLDNSDHSIDIADQNGPVDLIKIR